MNNCSLKGKCMGEVRVIEVGESILADNDRIADGIREMLKTQGTLFLNLMSGPGSGKMATCLSQLYHDNKRGVKSG